MTYTQNELKCAVFDLDGTLINTLTDLKNCCEYIMKKHGSFFPHSEDDYKLYVGNGIKKMIERAFEHTLSEDELNLYFSEFMPYYNEHMLDNTDAYDGMREQLAILKEKGIKLSVVTNKAESAAIGMLETIFGKGVFDVIVGQREGLPAKPDPAGVYKVLKELGCSKDEALFFGDSNVDMQTAINAGVKAVGVTWGFRSYEELKALSPYKIINSPSEISELY